MGASVRVAADEAFFDPAKDRENVRRHGISLARYVDLDVLAFLVDGRRDFGEERFRAWGLIDGASYCLAYTLRGGRVRPISLRRAHAKEMRRYAEGAQSDRG